MQAFAKRITNYSIVFPICFANTYKKKLKVLSIMLNFFEFFKNKTTKRKTLLKKIK
jgi:hypothetical protein